MIGNKAVEKTIIPLIGLISGILLFLGVFSASAEATLFNPGYHGRALRKLGASSLINDKIYEYLEASEYSELIGPYIEDHVNEELVITNINSLYGGLLNYIKGAADTLPYIYFNCINETTDPSNMTTDEIKASPLLAFTKIDRVNLRLPMMFLNEKDADDILKTASLLQYCIEKALIISLILLQIISIFIICQNPELFLDWVKYTSFSYSIISIASIYFLSSFKNLGQYSLESTLRSIDADLFKLVSNYLTHISASIIKLLFLSVVLIFVLLCLSVYRTKAASNHTLDMHRHIKKPALWTTVMILTALSALLYLQIGSAVSEYSQRNLKQAVMLLHGSNIYGQPIDARGNDVCFLRISVTDSLTGEPLEASAADIYQINRDKGSFYKAASFGKGSSSFLLEKGSYRLIISYENAFHDIAFRTLTLYDFELDRPGRTELNMVLDKESEAAIRIKSASLQYIP